MNKKGERGEGEGEGSECGLKEGFNEENKGKL